MKAIVTLRLEKNPDHDPKKKKLGPCPLNKNMLCTDMTGKHHSYVEEGTCINDIREKALQKHSQLHQKCQISRIEVLEK